jgi:hypothetical protein
MQPPQQAKRKRAKRPAPVQPVAVEQQQGALDPTTPFVGQPLIGLPTVSAPSESDDVDVVPAKTGVGAQGRYKESGLVITPIKAYFRTQQRTELEMKVPHAMNLYVAEHGHFPKTPEDFQRDIIQFNQVRLPRLPPGHRYVYDAKRGQLLVEQPRE